MENFLGPLLQHREKEIQISELRNKGMVLLYFSASWSPPCRSFTPILSKFYRKANKPEKQLEIIFISCDISEDQYNEYYSTMPWLSVPYKEQGIKDIATRHYEISAIPGLILVNEFGAPLHESCRIDIMSKDLNACILHWRDKLQPRSSRLVF